MKQEDHGALQRFREGLRFLEAQSWHPTRAARAVQEFEEDPTRERYLAARAAVDETLQAFRDVLAKRVLELRANAFDDGTIQRLTELSKTAAAAMFRPRFSPLDDPAVLVAASPPT